MRSKVETKVYASRRLLNERRREQLFEQRVQRNPQRFSKVAGKSLLSTALRKEKNRVAG